MHQLQTLQLNPKQLDGLFYLCIVEDAMPPPLRLAWCQFLLEHSNDDSEQAGDGASQLPPAKRRPPLFTEAGAPAAVSDAAAGNGDDADATTTPQLSVLHLLRQISSQVTLQFLSSSPEHQSAERLAATLETQALVLRLHALRFAGIDAVLDLRKHVLVWEAALRRLGGDAAQAPQYLTSLLDISISLFAVPQCALFTSTIKALLFAIVTLPWMAGTDAVSASSSETYQVLSNITSVEGLQQLWKQHLQAAMPPSFAPAAVAALALVPVHCNSEGAQRVLVAMLQQSDSVLRCAAIHTVPFFIASCRRQQRVRIEYTEFKDLIRPLLTNSDNAPEVTETLAATMGTLAQALSSQCSLVMAQVNAEALPNVPHDAVADAVADAVDPVAPADTDNTDGSLWLNSHWHGLRHSCHQLCLAWVRDTHVTPSPQRRLWCAPPRAESEDARACLQPYFGLVHIANTDRAKVFFFWERADCRLCSELLLTSLFFFSLSSSRCSPVLNAWHPSSRSTAAISLKNALPLSSGRSCWTTTALVCAWPPPSEPACWSAALLSAATG